MTPVLDTPGKFDFTFTIPKGPKGDDGADGAPGVNGAPGAPFVVGTVTTNTAESTEEAAVEMTPVLDTPGKFDLMFTIPKGPKGEDGADGADGAPGVNGAPGAPFSVGNVTTTTAESTEEAAVEMTPVLDTPGKFDFKFTIPKGPKGDDGSVGSQGPQGSQGIAGPTGPPGVSGPAGSSMAHFVAATSKDIQVGSYTAQNIIDPGIDYSLEKFSSLGGGFFQYDGTASRRFLITCTGNAKLIPYADMFIAIRREGLGLVQLLAYAYAKNVANAYSYVAINGSSVSILHAGDRIAFVIGSYTEYNISYGESMLSTSVGEQTYSFSVISISDDIVTAPTPMPFNNSTWYVIGGVNEGTGYETSSSSGRQGVATYTGTDLETVNYMSTLKSRAFTQIASDIYFNEQSFLFSAPNWLKTHSNNSARAFVRGDVINSYLITKLAAATLEKFVPVS